MYYKIISYILIFSVLLTYLANVNILNGNIANGLIAIIISFGFFLRLRISVPIKKILLILVATIPVAINLEFNLSAIVIVIFLFLMVDKFDYDQIRKLTKIVFITSLSSFVMVVVLYYVFGFNQQQDVSMWRIDKVIDRNSLGFFHPNTATMVWASIVFLVPIVFKEKLRFASFLFLILSIYIYTNTFSRTSSFVIIIYLLFNLLFGNKIFNETRISPNLIKFIPIILSMISILIIFLPTNQLLNQILSGRIVLYKQFYNMNGGIHLLGNSLLENQMFDNSYLQSILAKGVLFFLVQMIIYYRILKNKRIYNYIQLLFVLCYFFMAYTETILFKIELIISWILIFNYYRKGE